MTQRTDKLDSLMQREIQLLINRGLNDPRVRGMITVTAARVMPDLSETVVSVSVLPSTAESLTLQGLQAASSHLRSQLARQIDLRKMPRLVFKIDHSLKKQAALDAAIHANNLPPAPPASPEHRLSEDTQS